MITVVASGLRLGVVPLSLACCAVEVAVATHDAVAAEATAAAGDDVPPTPVDAHVLVVAGTVTRASADVVRARWEALPEPRFVVSFGACATSGGPYWDSYAVVPGVDRLVPVDVYVPGCPPRPEEVDAAIALLAAGLAADPARLGLGAGAAAGGRP